MALFDPIRMGASGASGGYEIERSIRMDGRDDQTNFRFTPSSQGDRRKFTISWWMKAGHFVTGDQNDNYLFSARRGSNNPQFDISFNHERLQVVGVTGGSYSYQVMTQRVFRDCTNWMHFVVAFDTANSTSSDRIKIYVNGQLQSNFDNSSYPSQSFQTAWNTNEAEENIGRTFYGSGNYNFDGYLAEIHNISSLALTPDNFGETDSVTGQWIPKKYSGADGDTSCRWYLKFTDNSNNTAATIGKDYSGQSNNWTPYNISTHNSVLDSPTNNFCTMNVIDKNANSNIDVRKGLLKPTCSHGFRAVRGTFGVKSGKWYWEVRTISMSDSFIGVMGFDTKCADDRGGETVNDIVLRQNDGDARSFQNNYGWGGSSYAASGDILMFALDMDSGLMFFGKNGTWMNSANPANGTGFANYTSAEQYRLRKRTLPVVSLYDNRSCQYNFGQDDTFEGAISATGNTDGNGLGVFKYAPPTGFLALCSKNMPDPAVKNGNKYHGTLTWTGNSTANRTISDTSIVDFTPDWVWVKCRTAGHDHQVTDAVRGTSKALVSNTTGGEVDWETSHSGSYKGMGAYVNGGFVLKDDGNNARYNANSQNYVGWTWFAGNSTVTNSNGQISTQVRVSQTSGFAICTWTGDGQNPRTIGHGLGVAPNFCFIKRRDTSGQNWIAASFDEESARELNTGNGFSTGDYDAFFPSQPTSTVVSLSSNDNCNRNNATYVGYFFANVEGHIDSGVYTGNGSSDGAFVNLGFRPAWVIYKRFDSSDDGWYIQDTTRSPENVTRVSHNASSNGNESGENIGDICSNGFKIRIGGNGNFNANNAKYIYLAFGDLPFKTSNSR